MITVRRIAAADGPLLRRTRLAAIADTPTSFLTSLEQAKARTDEQWAEAAVAHAAGASQATFFAVDDDEVVGMIGAYMMVGGVANLVGLWSAPGYRDSGVADALLNTVADWATRSGGRHLRLWVVGQNEDARRFYIRHGFEPTGATVPYEPDPSVVQIELIRPLLQPA